MYDLKSKYNAVIAYAAAAIGSAGTKTGAEVDLAGYRGVVFNLHYGNMVAADVVATVEVQHSDTSGSGYIAVPDSMLQGTEADASLAATEKNLIKKIGYVGNKRYVRIVWTTTGTADTGIIAAHALRHSADVEPCA